MHDTFMYTAYLFIRAIFLRIGPTVILAILNTLILYKFFKIAEDLPGSLNSAEERRLVLLLISIVLLFICCTTPAAVLSIYHTTKLDDHLGFQVFRAVANNLELVNFSLNFYIYCLCSEEIRRAFASLFTNFCTSCFRAKGPGNTASMRLTPGPSSSTVCTGR
jgi:hypothetical protein